MNTTGIYSIVRNPLYLGNFVAMLGVLICVKVWWVIAIFALCYWLYIERVIAVEEAFLEGKFGEAYRGWAQQTPAFIPRVRNWRAPSEGFSLPFLLRREYNGVLAVGASFFILEFILDIFLKNQTISAWVEEDFAWVAVGAMTLAVFLVLWVLKMQTRLLDEGRIAK